jgi:hypothetical protein
MIGYTLFEDEDGHQFWWKDCETPGCANQVCTWLSSRFCHPCTCRRAAMDARQRAPIECRTVEEA